MWSFEIDKAARDAYGDRERTYGGTLYGHASRVEKAIKNLGKVSLGNVALLHDVLEDTDKDFEWLLSVVSRKEALLVLELTRAKTETYREYINRLGRDAAQVKICDILDNLDECPSETLRDRYELSLQVLRDKFGG